ncbi:uncharacterized protein PGRI_028560 [Penicillium griseofulvum]|uniref:Uncharacterized protein n=1 Tax=Penicillium patulum TaxID=5078 RepID=A0A135LJ37_PENPA|nr:uncharacterized protein PGRI_028560 [Penicillium griseofulvum]KXG48986.1 hypothetical protein PGRI_028560 [Penicillium griseofulvum]
MDNFPKLKPKLNRFGQVEYEPSDFPMHSLPMAEHSEGIRLDQKVLADIGIKKEYLPDVPQFILHPNMDHTKKKAPFRSVFPYIHEHEPKWINGDIVVYRPIRWVPYVMLIQFYPKSELTTTIKVQTTNVLEKELYGKASFSVEASAALSYKDMALGFKATGEGHVTVTRNIKELKDLTEEGSFKYAVNELGIGMMMEVEEVARYEFRNDDIWEDFYEEEGVPDGTELHWGGDETWEKIHIRSNELNLVKQLQVVDGDLYIQMLPLPSDDKREIADMYVALSFKYKETWRRNVTGCKKAWEDWYAYIHGTFHSKVSKQNTYLAWPAWKPISTFRAVEPVKPT